MDFALPRASRTRLEDLVVTLDREEEPVAATWRRVSEAAVALGLPRPSYHHVRRLVLVARRRRELRRELNNVLVEAAGSFAAGRVPGFDYTLGRLLDAHEALATEKACVSETQASPAAPRQRPG
jgi:hypothetical protein